MADISLEIIPASRCLADYGWGSEAREGSYVLHLTIGAFEVFCDETRVCYGPDPADMYGCEVYHDGDMVAQVFGSGYREAITAGLAEAGCSCTIGKLFNILG